ncbi:MAG TPA: hypothetical protein VKF82_07485 [Candidatus Eremiobacteraceae bacterium]|nr:hypothetical protein [Candidatus Eremiobacteraceae bacterium]
MKRIAILLLGGLLVTLDASPSGAWTYTWKLANPSSIVAYQVGKGVITIASASACPPSELVPESTPFAYDFKLGSAKGLFCLAGTGTIAAYYEAGSPSTVTVKTTSGTRTVPVAPVPPTNPAIGHLPFH